MQGNTTRKLQGNTRGILWQQSRS